MNMKTIKTHEEFLKTAREERIRISTRKDPNDATSKEKNIMRIESSFADIKQILKDCLDAIKKGKDKSYEQFFSCYQFLFYICVNESSDLNSFILLLNDAKSEGIQIEFSLHLCVDESSGLDSFISLLNDVKAKGLQPNKTFLEWKSHDLGRIVRDLFLCIDKKTDKRMKIVADVIIFNIKSDSAIIDTTSIHKYLLFCCKFKDLFGEFRLYIYSSDDQIMEEESNFYRLNALIDNSVDFENVKIFLGKNRKDISKVPARKTDVGMLPPAIYVEEEDYHFLRCPLKKEIWDLIVNKKKKVQKKGEENLSFYNAMERVLLGNEKKYKAYLHLCQRCLFEEFDKNESREYTRLRYGAYSNEKFYKEYVSKIPFLALLLFALYDNHYRDENLRRFKDYSNVERLKGEDFLLIKQEEQERNRYKKYDNLKRINESYDIKNLVDFDKKDQINLDDRTQPIKYHKTVEAEIFESVSISEGILQILENAVEHADGGLLSMRIYNRANGIKTHNPKKPEHVEYLDRVYAKDYFDYSRADFYLEIQLSDFSSMSMPEKHIENIKDNLATDPDIKNELVEAFKKLDKYDIQTDKEFYILLEQIKKKMGIYYFFSSPYDESDISLKDFKECYYSISKCRIHHYGLETFNSIVTARNGIFSVGGHKDSYNNVHDIINRTFGNAERFIADNTQKKCSNIETKLKNKIEEEVKKEKDKVKKKIETKLNADKDLPGVSYRLLLPLNHTRAIVYNSTEMPEYDSIDYEANIVPVPIDRNAEGASIYIIRKAKKQKRIDDFSGYILKTLNDCYQTNSTMLPCINIDGILAESNSSEEFESIIKGTLLAGLEMRKKDSNTIPIAITNMTPFQFIEASRIIAIYYNKTSDPKGIFDRIHIYLKCKDEPKSIIFSGSDLQSVRDGMLRTAMRTGSMFDELDTIALIFERLISPRYYENREETNE